MSVAGLKKMMHTWKSRNITDSTTTQLPELYLGLVEISKKFKSEGVQELILDLRYNGGGYVITENAMGSMYAFRLEFLADFHQFGDGFQVEIQVGRRAGTHPGPPLQRWRIRHHRKRHGVHVRPASRSQQPRNL